MLRLRGNTVNKPEILSVRVGPNTKDLLKEYVQQLDAELGTSLSQGQALDVLLQRAVLANRERGVS